MTAGEDSARIRLRRSGERIVVSAHGARAEGARGEAGDGGELESCPARPEPHIWKSLGVGTGTRSVPGSPMDLP